MTITLYRGNSGRAERIHENAFHPPKYNAPPEKKARGGTSSIIGIDGDILVLGIMILLYLESRDTDFLIIAAVLMYCFYKDSPAFSKLGKLLQP